MRDNSEYDDLIYIHPKTGNRHGCTKCRREAFLRWKAKKGGDS